MKLCVVCNTRYATPRTYITCESIACHKGYARYKAQKAKLGTIKEAQNDIRILTKKIQQVGNWKKQIESAKEFIAITKRLNCG